MNSFNPFNKDIRDLGLSDLESLGAKQVSEGFYVEYKSDFPSNDKISHSIASFANAYGGWYLVGIVADANNVPKELPGFDLRSFPNPKEKVRDIIASHINPLPLFFTKLIEVNENRGILVVFVPESLETPHLTKDGRVYRRAGEASEPIPENDRYTIDKLYDKSRRFKDTVERFCQNPVAISKAQSKQGWLEIYLMTYPLGKLFIDDLLRRDKIDRVKSCLDKVIEIKSFKQIGQMSGNVPFNNIATSHNSIIFRQTSPENLGDLTLTFEFFVNGNAKIFIPFEYVNPHGDKNSENLQFLREQLGEQAYLFWIIDGFKLLLLFLFLLDKYRELLEAEGWTDKLIIKYRVENCWRHILSFDSEAFVNHVKKYGIPICQREQIQIPGYTYRAWFTDSFERISEHVLSDFVQVAESLGLHLESFLEAVLEGLPAYSNKLPR